MAEHTPGTWEMNDNEELQIFTQPNKGIAMCYRLGDVEWGDDAPLHDEAEANARLIAAAPDLLEALENLVSEATVATDSEHGAYLNAQDLIARIRQV